ncbi:hypothetical protein SESBI_44103 [Sesbania bispinosa]|nr:hypothetical protein SESBI_44103 [Sesbania bispinosa]
MPGHNNPIVSNGIETGTNQKGTKRFDIVYSRKQTTQRNEPNDPEHHHESKDPSNDVPETTQSIHSGLDSVI